jgi:hypothetical protein
MWVSCGGRLLLKFDELTKFLNLDELAIFLNLDELANFLNLDERQVSSHIKSLQMSDLQL